MIFINDETLTRSITSAYMHIAMILPEKEKKNWNETVKQFVWGINEVQNSTQV